MIVIDAVPKKLYWYRLYCNGQLLEAACSPRILTLDEEIRLYESWAMKFGAPTFEGFTHSLAMREIYAQETATQRRMREEDARTEALEDETEQSRFSTGFMKNSFKDLPHMEAKPGPDAGYGFDEKEYGYDPGHPGGDWSAFWYRRSK